ncbi:MAG: L,D-transpeptidase family protein [Desulfobacteraceae bacterium]|nr:L,D-transpeptidase family protein [Desulfobacteraceae bacterium]MBC2718961.1 L,D-transpeptidase family protein [Desulfobacteraceae bacterium]
MVRTIYNLLFLLLMLQVTESVFAASHNQGVGTELRPAMLIASGTEGNEYAIVVEKNNQRLFLYEYDGKRYKEINRFKCSTGEASGAKSVSGDKKTPEGVYFFTKEYKKKELAPIYGTRAFPTDYPNFLDRIAGRDGHSIWMHGTNKSLKPRDSNGCVALANSDIEKLSKYITLTRTPIIIVDKISYVTGNSDKKIAESISNFLFNWNNALENDTYHEYLSYYNHKYLPDISWWPEWNKLREKNQSSDMAFSIEIKVSVISMHKGIYVVLIDQIVRTSEMDFPLGTKKIFIAKKKDKLKIVGEEYLVFSNMQKPTNENQKNILIVTCKKLKNTFGDKQDIKDLINTWVKAWSAKDIKQYSKCYAKNFVSQGGATLQNWLKYKNYLNKKYDFINVSIDNLVVKKDRNTSKVSFIQTYVSSGFRSVSLKRLELICGGGVWKIYREISKDM